MADIYRLHTATRLVQRLLPNPDSTGNRCQLPIVVLLGPAGAGKTTALTHISKDCGSTVVHSRPYDFGTFVPEAEEDASTATTALMLASIANDFSRGWTGRPSARFYRFTTAWIAAHLRLPETPRTSGTDELRMQIDELTSRRTKGIDDLSQRLINAMTTAPSPLGWAANVAKEVLPSLIRSLGRRPLRRASRWHTDFPPAEGGSWLDALYTLNQFAVRGQADDVTQWLMHAFLADVRDNFPRMARHDPQGTCGCEVLDGNPHWHNWVLLLDNVDRPAGRRFLADLIRARQQTAQQCWDPLLVIAASGRWDRSWEPAWRPVWIGEPSSPGLSRQVRRELDTSYQDWAGQSSSDLSSSYYPVLLELPRTAEIAKMIRADQYGPECAFAQWATGSLPGAVEEIAPLLRSGRIEAGRRDVLLPADTDEPDRDPWPDRLARLRLEPDPQFSELLDAAPFATAPWLIPAGADIRISQPRIGQIITGLRTALWVTYPADDTATANRVELHPWLTSSLNLALAHSRSNQERLSYRTRFEVLLAHADTGQDPVRKAYCLLALGRIAEVIDHLVGTFDTVPHKDWNSRVRLIISAPDDLPLSKPSFVLYQELVEQDSRERPSGRAPARGPVARLVAAQWLAANHFAVPDPQLNRIVKDCYAQLQALSQRPDTSDLEP